MHTLEKLTRPENRKDWQIEGSFLIRHFLPGPERLWRLCHASKYAQSSPKAGGKSVWSSFGGCTREDVYHQASRPDPVMLSETFGWDAVGQQTNDGGAGSVGRITALPVPPLARLWLPQLQFAAIRDLWRVRESKQTLLRRLNAGVLISTNWLSSDSPKAMINWRTAVDSGPTAVSELHCPIL
jgi:hypothetical protein